MVLLYRSLYILLMFSVANAYKLDKKLENGNFFSSFDFIETHDKYTGGYATYVSKDEATSMGLARIIGVQVYLGVDNGIVIADFTHLPANACGMWPALQVSTTGQCQFTVSPADREIAGCCMMMRSTATSTPKSTLSSLSRTLPAMRSR